MSKGRSIPLNELANLHGRSVEAQYEACWAFTEPLRHKISSYNLVKASAAEATGAVGGLLAEVGVRTLSDDELKREALRRAKGDVDNLNFNWPPLLALRDWSRDHVARAVHREFPQVTLLGGQRVSLVVNVIAVFEGRGHLLTLDPRRAKTLTRSGLYVLQSMVHHLLREQYPDLSDLDIAILQFPEMAELIEKGSKARKRQIITNRLGDRSAMDYRDLSDGIRETLSIFQRVLRDRAA